MQPQSLFVYISFWNFKNVFLWGFYLQYKYNAKLDPNFMSVRLAKRNLYVFV